MPEVGVIRFFPQSTSQLVYTQEHHTTHQPYFRGLLNNKITNKMHKKCKHCGTKLNENDTYLQSESYKKAEHHLVNTHWKVCTG